MEALQCLSTEEFMLFISLIADVVEQVGEIFVVHSTSNGDIYWQQTDADTFCTYTFKQGADA